MEQVLGYIKMLSVGQFKICNSLFKNVELDARWSSSRKAAEWVRIPPSLIRIGLKKYKTL